HGLLDLGHAQGDALVHGRAARIDVEHVDAVDDVVDLVLLGDPGGGEQDQGVVGEGDDGDAVVGLELADGGPGGVLDALEAALAGAVFLVHRAADVQHQGQVQPHRFTRAAAAGDQFEEGVTGHGLSGDRDAVAVQHALEVDTGFHG